MKKFEKKVSVSETKNFGSDTETDTFGQNSAPIPNFGRTLVKHSTKNDPRSITYDNFDGPSVLLVFLFFLFYGKIGTKFHATLNKLRCAYA